MTDLRNILEFIYVDILFTADNLQYYNINGYSSFHLYKTKQLVSIILVVVKNNIVSTFRTVT